MGQYLKTLEDDISIKSELELLKFENNSKSNLIEKSCNKITMLVDVENNSKSDLMEKSRDKITMLVDVENLPRFIDDLLLNEKYRNLQIYAFIGYHHPLAEKEYPSNVIKVISPSTRKNGTDSCMQVYTGVLLYKELYNMYYIITKDYFGTTLVEMITSPNLGWIPKSAKLISRISQLTNL